MAQNKPLPEDAVVVSFDDTLTYPLAARLAHVQGVVVVHVSLGDDGRVVSSEAISGVKSLTPDCLINSKKWRFQPNPAKTAVIVYDFRFKGLCNGLCASQFLFHPPNFVSITVGDTVVDHSASN